MLCNVLFYIIILLYITDSFSKRNKQKKYEEAVKYLQDGVSNDKADTPGNTFALYILGDSYYYGIGVEKENRS